MDSEHWHLHLHGRPRLLRGREEVPLIDSDAAWLALVACGPGLPARRLAQWVWPGGDDERALNNLRQRALRLRRRLGCAAVDIGQVPRLAASVRFVAFDPEGLREDPRRPLEPLLGAADHDPRPEFAAWLDEQRRREHALCVAVLESCAQDAEARGELASALQLAVRLLHEAPLSEAALRRVMHLHHLRGDRTAALSAFESFESRLKAETGGRPTDDTLRLLALVESADPVPTPAVGVSTGLLRPPRRIGGGQAWARLAEAVADGAFALVEGEAGIGKSRLLNDFLQGREDAVAVRAGPGDAAVPYQALLRLMAALGAPDLPAEALRRTELLPIVQQARQRGVGLIALDDLHHADRASVEMLVALGDATAQGPAPVAWVCTTRPASSGEAARAVHQAFAASTLARWITLEPLTEAETADLVRSLGLPGYGTPDWAQALRRHSGGNPLFVLETLRALGPTAASAPRPDLPVPGSVRHLLDERFTQLSEGAMALARVAAVAGADFSIELAEQALQLPAARLAQGWSELERADILQGLSFAHDLVQEAARRVVPAVIAQHLHRCVAAHLQATGAEAARIAPHWWQGHHWSAAAGSFEAAARGAARVARLSEQAQFLAYAAMARFQLGETDEGLACACDAVVAAASSDGPAAARQLCERLAQASGRPDNDPSLRVMRGYALVLQGDFAEALALARTVLDAPPGLPAALRLDAGLVCALAKTSLGDTAAGVELVERVREQAAPPCRVAALLRFRSLRCATLLCHRRYSAAEQAARDALQLAREAEVLDEQISALDSLANILERRGDLAAAMTVLEEARELMRDRSSFAMLARWSDLHAITCLGGLGHFAKALALAAGLAADMLALGADPGIHAAAIDATARLYLAVGQGARALQALAGADPEDHARRAARLELRAALARALGQDARALIDAGLALDASGLAASVRWDLELLRVRCEPEPAQAEAQLIRLRQRATELDTPWRVVSADAERIRLLLQRPVFRFDAHDLADFEHAARRWRVLGNSLPEHLHLVARGWSALGRQDDARRCLTEALQELLAVANRHLPDEYRDGYLERVEAHRALRQDAARQGIRA